MSVSESDLEELFQISETEDYNDSRTSIRIGNENNGNIGKNFPVANLKLAQVNSSPNTINDYKRNLTRSEKFILDIPPMIINFDKDQQLNNLMNLRALYKQSEISANQKKELLRIAARTPKTKIDLNPEEQDFKNRFYGIFTTRKKFVKKYVGIIHNCFLTKKFNFDKICRNEARQIDLYFQKYTEHKEPILKYLEEKKTEISQMIYIKPRKREINV